MKPNIPNDKLKEKQKLMLHLLGNSAILITLYFVISEKFQFPYIMFIYLAAGVGLGLYYVIYNRGFVGKNATPDVLPDTMSPAEKQAFLDDSKARLQKSRWVLTLLIPIILTFAADMIYLFLFPQLKEIFL